MEYSEKVFREGIQIGEKRGEKKGFEKGIIL